MAIRQLVMTVAFVANQHHCPRNLRIGEGDARVGKRDFPGGTVVKHLPASAGDTGSTPGPGRSHTCLRVTKPVHTTTTEPACCNY